MGGNVQNGVPFVRSLSAILLMAKLTSMIFKTGTCFKIDRDRLHLHAGQMKPQQVADPRWLLEKPGSGTPQLSQLGGSHASSDDTGFRCCYEP
jgi:hypothetical protein